MSSDRLLPDPIDEEAKRVILSAFFQINSDSVSLHAYDSYFQYYDREINRLLLGLPVPFCAISGLAAKSHSDIAVICQVLAKDITIPRRVALERLRSIFPRDDHLSINRSIDLTIRLWLMLNVSDNDPRLMTPFKTSIQWDESSSLSSMIMKQFSRSSELAQGQHRLNVGFTAAYMVRVCGLDLRWTESLEDHLKLELQGKTLWIFPFKDFLNCHLKNRVGEGLGDEKTEIFPSMLLRETIITLDLLFPAWDVETQQLLRKHRQTFHSVSPFTEPCQISLDGFYFWRDRLIRLQNDVYGAPPGSLRQLWVDRRNPHQYYTFWIAVFVFGMTLISLAASIVQAWASVKSLQLQASYSARA